MIGLKLTCIFIVVVFKTRGNESDWNVGGDITAINLKQDESETKLH